MTSADRVPEPNWLLHGDTPLVEVTVQCERQPIDEDGLPLTPFEAVRAHQMLYDTMNTLDDAAALAVCANETKLRALIRGAYEYAKQRHADTREAL